MSIQETELKTERFSTAVETGTVTHKSGYHQPDSRRSFHRRGCGCTKTTPKGAYRDVTVEMSDGRTIHYYHQSPVVVETPTAMRLSSCGWKTSTTKERLNRHVPRGYYVRQEDFTWYLEKPDGTREQFTDGMVIEK